jgi:hypothetical protein
MPQTGTKKLKVGVSAKRCTFFVFGIPVIAELLTAILSGVFCLWKFIFYDDDLKNKENYILTYAHKINRHSRGALEFSADLTKTFD